MQDCSVPCSLPGPPLLLNGGELGLLLGNQSPPKVVLQSMHSKEIFLNLFFFITFFICFRKTHQIFILPTYTTIIKYVLNNVELGFERINEEKKMQEKSKKHNKPRLTKIPNNVITSFFIGFSCRHVTFISLSFWIYLDRSNGFVIKSIISDQLTTLNIQICLEETKSRKHFL